MIGPKVSGDFMLEFGSALNVGRTRFGKKNQDNLLILKRRPLFPLLVLADGMGGYRGGEVASQLVIDSFTQTYKTIDKTLSKMDFLQVALLAAHEKVIKAASTISETTSMGSTVVAVGIDLKNSELNLVNVGDSRAYLLHANGVKQISYDHSEVAELIRSGALSEQDAITYKRKNVLTMSISANRSIGGLKPYFAKVPFVKDSVLLLCSDGLWGSVPEALIHLVALEMRPQRAAEKLVQLANDFGGPDNISVIIARRRFDFETYRTKHSVNQEDTLV